MIASMTSFGRREETIEQGYIAWEIRTVNHRYLDIELHLPKEMRILESRIRGEISRYIKRGKVDCSLLYESEQSGADEIRINQPLAKRILDIAQNLANSSTELTSINPIDIMRWPGVLVREKIDPNTISTTLLAVLEKTLKMVMDMRYSEGREIQRMIQSRCEGVIRIVADMERAMPDILNELRDKLNTRINELTAQLDHDQLEREALLLAKKTDVAEELERLQAHTVEIKHTLETGNRSGRRIDFLLQEMNREANTLGSKSINIKMTNAAIELKVLIEQMREQAQNLE